jgi:hypothetical protein
LERKDMLRDSLISLVENEKLVTALSFLHIGLADQGTKQRYEDDEDVRQEEQQLEPQNDNRVTLN